MKGEGERGNGDEGEELPRRPLQFRLSTAMGIMAGWSVLFATLRWLGVPPEACTVILVVLTVSVAAAVALVVMLAQSGEE